MINNEVIELSVPVASRNESLKDMNGCMVHAFSYLMKYYRDAYDIRPIEVRNVMEFCVQQDRIAESRYKAQTGEEG